MKKIKVNAVVFDYGNTIVHDPFQDILKLKAVDFQKTFEKSGYNIGRKEIIEKWNEANENVNYIHISHFAQEEPIIEEALENLGIKHLDVSSLSKELLSIYRDGYKQIYSSDQRRNEIQSTLKSLKEKGKKLAVFSNGRSSDVRMAMKLYKVFNLFDFIIASEEIGTEKPSSLVFDFILKKIGESPQNVLYVGDDPIRDVQASKQKGMKAVLYIPPKKYRKSTPWRKYDDKVFEKPDAIITKFSQLSKIIE